MSVKTVTKMTPLRGLRKGAVGSQTCLLTGSLGMHILPTSAFSFQIQFSDLLSA